MPGTKRLIIATVATRARSRTSTPCATSRAIDKIKEDNPNLVEIAAKGVFRLPAGRWWPIRCRTSRSPPAKERVELMKKRAELRIGIPRVLNMYSAIPPSRPISSRWASRTKNLVYSDFTSEELYKDGAKRGAIDPCFPSKLGIPHVHNLLYVHHKKKPLDIIFFPMIDDLPSDMATCRAIAPARPCDYAGGREGGLHQGKRSVRRIGRRVPGYVRQHRRARPVRAADVRDVQGHPRPVARRE